MFIEQQKKEGSKYLVLGPASPKTFQTSRAINHFDTFQRHIQEIVKLFLSTENQERDSKNGRC